MNDGVQIRRISDQVIIVREETPGLALHQMLAFLNDGILNPNDKYYMVVGGETFHFGNSTCPECDAMDQVEGVKP